MISRFANKRKYPEAADRLEQGPRWLWVASGFVNGQLVYFLSFLAETTRDYFPLALALVMDGLIIVALMVYKIYGDDAMKGCLLRYTRSLMVGVVSAWLLTMVWCDYRGNNFGEGNSEPVRNYNSHVLELHSFLTLTFTILLLVLALFSVVTNPCCCPRNRLNRIQNTLGMSSSNTQPLFDLV